MMKRWKPVPPAALVPPALLAAILVLLPSGCSDSDDGPAPGPGPGTPAAEFVIQVNSSSAGPMAFVPARDTVQAGQVVRMRNGDTVTHVIETATAGGPNWGGLSGGQARDVTAGTAGSFTFTCTVSGHTMSGVLVVLP